MPRIVFESKLRAKLQDEVGSWMDDTEFEIMFSEIIEMVDELINQLQGDSHESKPSL